MGVVYRAEDTRLKREVAIKLLPRAITDNDDTRDRFIQEARAASSLDHNNICTIYEIDSTDEGQTFMVMASYEGETLRDKIKAGPLEISEAIDITVQIAEGLVQAHRKGIVHRDIKPANIFITEEGTAKILDFGLAKLEGTTRITREGTTMGTAAYMSPEQAHGDSVDSRTDIWSLGVIFYEMLSGQLPFAGAYDQAVIYSILNDRPENIRKYNDSVPSSAERVIKKALAKEPENRYQDIKELIEDLKYTEKVKTSITSKEESNRRQKSIAVLPFADMSPQRDQEYFCEGLAEELINALAQIKPLRVAARTSAFSFKGGNYDVRDIGSKLNVDTVLEGSIRKAGDQLRITAQLISAADGYHIWSERYDRRMEDIFLIQDEISLAIVDQLKIELLGEEAARLVKRGTRNLEAYDLYVRGRFFWEKRGGGLLKSIEYFEKAIEKDPDYPAPYIGMADSYSMLSFYGYMPSHEAVPLARENALKALSLDSNISNAYSALGWIYQYYDWNPPVAREQFRKAIDLNPANTAAHYWYSTSLVLDGYRKEAIRENEIAVELDPLSVQAHTSYGWNLIGLGDNDEALVKLGRALELNPDYPLAHMLLGYTYFMLSDQPKAEEEFEKAVKLSRRNPWMLSMKGTFCAITGQESKGRKLLEELLERSESEHVQSLYIAYIHAGLGDLDEAFKWLEKSYLERDQYLIVFLNSVDPFTEPLWGDPRYEALREKIKKEM